MNARLALPILGCIAAVSLTAVPAIAQDQPRPARGKIDGVEREARRADAADDDGAWSDEDGGGVDLVFHVIGGTLNSLFSGPRYPGQGYTAFPYAEPGNPDRFAMEGMATGRSFGTVTGMYFDDRAAGGTLQAANLAIEGATGMIAGGFEYTLYREPTRRDTDWLHLVRFAIGAAPRLGPAGLGRALVGLRIIGLDNGRAAVGPELELGVQVFPVRPWGVSVTARGALVEWSTGGTSPFTDLMATGSYFLGRLELQAGWRYTKVGSAPAFSGPTAGVRVWF